MPQYMENGIKVRYIFMPLKGTDDINKTISVWCADDRNAALDIAKAGGEVEAKKCDNPILKHMELARKLGVRGTPAIILENGDMLPGYVPVNKLVTQLDTLNVSAAQ
jgi:thiol:disulfide interchange protein DsbC